ncbi:MAG TPA: HAMP domain-containing sensor histidine kinase [Streptosporangiaceae bacterium]|nr:HAMP domain-containing sensor histidine kinase [Streptosporangiaceae bacterium]
MTAPSRPLPPPPPPPSAPSRFRLRAPRTVRLRLTLLYVGLFLASAACLLVITYFLVAQQLPGTVTLRTSGGGTPGTGGQVTGGTGVGAAACAPPTDGTPPTVAQMNDCFQQAAAGLRNDTLDQLLIESGVALGIMAVASVGLGWLMAGRVLSPLRTITATARRISARNLHQRIAMSGPDDELKELGDTFDQLLGRLDASFRAQRQFVANASHELRTPLARQRTLLEVALRDNQATNASLRTACERALAAGEQQERLIASLLTLARGERGLDAFEPFDLGIVATGAVAAVRDEAEARGVTVTADLGPAAALGDSRLAEQLAANLAGNAVRYNVAGGWVEISTGARDGRAFLAVSNTGPVIPPDQLGRLFQPFQRLDPGRAGPERGGLGMGLAIVSAIAAAHGSELHAVTRAAGGLAIEVVFPPVPTRAGDQVEDQAGVEERAAALA